MAPKKPGLYASLRDRPAGVVVLDAPGGNAAAGVGAGDGGSRSHAGPARSR